MLTNLWITFEELQLKNKGKKTKMLIVDKCNKEMKRVIIIIEQVQSFCYLGNSITQYNRYTIEINKIIFINIFG